MKIRAITAEIFKPKWGDCSNNGISSKYNEVYVVCDDGNWEFDTDDLPENLCVIVRRELFGKNADYIRPYKDAPSNSVGYMYGGCIVDTSDSRFDSDHPLKLHDRTETQEEYDMYSR